MIRKLLAPATARLFAALFITCAHGAVAQNLSLRLPFDDRWFVAQGGDTPNVNHHMRSRAQAYGIDFAKVGGPKQRELTRRTPAAVADFYAWGAPILAPADGEVVAVVNDRPDNPIGVKDTTNPAGNHIVLRIAANRYVFLAHAQRGSITVEPGASVQRGMPIAACGNSGNSDFPHIHLHIQDAPTLGAG
jgi:hypothetical protein